MSSFLSRIKYALLLITGVVIAGTVGYRIGGMSWLDALYQTVITVSTVGYGDMAPPAMKPFTIILIGVGTLTLAIMISIVTGAFIELSLNQIIGRRKMENKIRNLRDHIILCGFGRFGRTIASELHRKGHDFVIIETDETRSNNAIEHGYVAISADATEEESLTHARIGEAHSLLTTLGTDAANVYVTLTAKQMAPKVKVVAVAMDPHERASDKLKAAGADDVVSPYQLGGAWMAQVVTSPTVADFMKIATGANPIDFYMDEQRIANTSSLSGRMLRETPIRSEFGVIVVAVRRGDGSLVTNPSPNLELGPGDVLVSLGQQEKLAALKQFAAGGT